MAEHTKTLVAGYIVTFFNGRQITPTDEAVIHFEGDEDSEIEIHCPDAPVLAAKIVKAVNNHDALLEFFKWAMREGPWKGGDLDGAAVQDKAESLGLIVKTKYDPACHGEDGKFYEGQDYYAFAPSLSQPPRPVGGSRDG